MRGAVAAISVLVISLAGCTSFGSPSATPPPGVNLSGIWKLDTRLSTNTAAALERIMPRSHRRRPRAARADYNRLRAGRRPAGGMMLRMPADLSLQRGMLSGGRYLRIEQRADAFVVSNGVMTNDYVPGEHSVVSVPHGVAVRRSGWRGKGYWIELHPEFGPQVTERFRLEHAGKRLVETIDIASDGPVRELKVTRVYVPARDIPTLLPSGN